MGYLNADYASPAEAELLWLYVAPEWRGHGYGTALLKKGLLQLADAGVMHVYLSTPYQQDFYGHVGFETFARNNNDDITVYEMSRNLHDPIITRKEQYV